MSNTSEKYFLENMNAVEVNKIHRSESIVFILLGSCENHGNHLPFGSDFLFPVNLVKLMLDNIIKSKRQKKV